MTFEAERKVRMYVNHYGIVPLTLVNNATNEVSNVEIETDNCEEAIAEISGYEIENEVYI